MAHLRKNVAHVKAGGGVKAMARHVARGKLPARERVSTLLDPGSPFLEMSPLAGWNMYGEDQVASGGIITGIGRVHGYVCAQRVGCAAHVAPLGCACTVFATPFHPYAACANARVHVAIVSPCLPLCAGKR